jgi:hypothetical protein
MRSGKSDALFQLVPARLVLMLPAMEDLITQPGDSPMRFLLICFLVFISPAVLAANFTVTNTSNSGAGSLRQALLDANASVAVPHIINFTAAYPQFGLITLQSDLPTITALDVRIRGNDRGPIVSGNSQYSIFQAAINVSLELEDMNLQQGLNDSGGCVATATPGGTGSLLVLRGYFFRCKANSPFSPGGGAIYWNANAPALVTIEDSAFFENEANSSNIDLEQPRGGAVESTTNSILRRNVFTDNAITSAGNRGGYGGAVFLSLSDPSGVSEISDSRFESNSVDQSVTSLGRGGAVRAYLVPGHLLLVERNFFLDNEALKGGALSLETQMLSTTTQVSMINNTYVSNSATQDGGAIYLYYMQLFANHNTFYLNSAASGSHLSLDNVQMRSLHNNVLADTQSNAACALNNSSIVSASLAGNLFDEDCGILSSTGGAISTKLGVQSIISAPRVGVVTFLPGEDPIDGGSPDPSFCSPTDAQGTSRPLDADGDDIAICDAGAYEAPSNTVFEDGFET